MNQKSSLREDLQFVSWVLTANTKPTGCCQLSSAAQALRGMEAHAETAVVVSLLLNWSRLSEQKFRVDKWKLCRG